VQEGIAGHLDPGSLLQYKQGFLADRANVNPFDWTTGDAKEADAVVVVMGLSGNFEGEEGESIASPDFGDRLNYDLPQNQIDFLKKLRKGNTKPIIVIVTAGSPVNMSAISELADAVLFAWYPGEEGGNAIADILFGKVSPSGRLPITFPKSLDQLPAYENYSMEGRTYRYMQEEPLYPFGYGLSYTKFSYEDLQLSEKFIKKGESVKLSFSLKNKGKVAAEEVVQLYIKRENDSIATPLFSLKGFKRVAVKAGETIPLSFTITPEMMTIVDNDGKNLLESGTVTVFIGGALPVQRSLDLGMSKGLSAAFEIK